MCIMNYLSAQNIENERGRKKGSITSIEVSKHMHGKHVLVSKLNSSKLILLVMCTAFY